MTHRPFGLAGIKNKKSEVTTIGLACEIPVYTNKRGPGLSRPCFRLFVSAAWRDEIKLLMRWLIRAVKYWISLSDEPLSVDVFTTKPSHSAAHQNRFNNRDIKTCLTFLKWKKIPQVSSFKIQFIIDKSAQKLIIEYTCILLLFMSVMWMKQKCGVKCIHGWN